MGLTWISNTKIFSPNGELLDLCLGVGTVYTRPYRPFVTDNTLPSIASDIRETFAV